MANARITEVLADLTTVVKVRYSAGGSAEAFSSNSTAERVPVEVRGEDLASVLVRFDTGAKGCFSVGQVLPGHKNGLRIELNGRKGSLGWDQERQNELWIGRHDGPNAVMCKDPSMMLGGAAQYAHLPAGHQEGWADAFRNVIHDAYEWIRTGERPVAVCTFAEAVRPCLLVEAMLKSHEAGCVWQRVSEPVEDDVTIERREVVCE